MVSCPGVGICSFNPLRLAVTKADGHMKPAFDIERLLQMILCIVACQILSNRQSASPSKKRKVHHIFYNISEVERKVQTLQTKATTLQIQLTLFLDLGYFHPGVSSQDLSRIIYPNKAKVGTGITCG